MKADKTRLLQTRLRLKLGPVILLGPGKADLLRLIDQSGSISAAARAMGMSYKRAWQLVDEMNRHFNQPVVGANPGGIKGGGAHLTLFGQEVLKRYGSILDHLEQAAGDDLDWLNSQIAPPSTDTP